MQRVVVVDTDIDIRSPDDIEWAIAMRMNAEDKIRVFAASGRSGSTARLGIDATRGPGSANERPTIPGENKYRLDKYR